MVWSGNNHDDAVRIAETQLQSVKADLDGRKVKFRRDCEDACIEHKNELEQYAQDRYSDPHPTMPPNLEARALVNTAIDTPHPDYNLTEVYETLNFDYSFEVTENDEDNAKKLMGLMILKNGDSSE